MINVAHIISAMKSSKDGICIPKGVSNCFTFWFPRSYVLGSLGLKRNSSLTDVQTTYQMTRIIIKKLLHLSNRLRRCMIKLNLFVKQFHDLQLQMGAMIRGIFLLIYWLSVIDWYPLCLILRGRTLLIRLPVKIMVLLPK